jgi:ATP-binding cassette, subfamily B, bacterial
MESRGRVLLGKMKIGVNLRRLLSSGEESEEAVQTVPVRELIRRFWPYARPYRRWMPLMLLLVALVPAVEAATIWMYKVLVDDVLVPGDYSLLWWVVPAYVVLTLVGGVARFGDEYMTEWVGGRFVVSLRTAVFGHLHALSSSFLDRAKLGDVLSRLNDDADEVEEMLLSGVTSALAYAFQLVFFVGALFYLEWRLALVSLLAAPLFWGSARYFSRKIKAASREERHRTGTTGAVAEESLSNTALVAAYDRGASEVEKFHRENEASFRAQLAATRLGALYSPLVNVIELCGVMAVILFGAYELSQGRLTIGGLLVFLVYLSGLYRPIRGLASLLNSFYAASAGAERILQLLDERPEIQDGEGALDIGVAEGRVRFEAVSFRYPGSERRALDNVSFEAAPGEVVALVGPSGAGKSTVARLLLRLRDPEAGSVTLDEHDLRDLTLSSLRANVAALLQETMVFDGTVRENIAYGRPGASEEEIIRAAEEADAHEFILSLPEGYDTVVGQKGRLLSGGQRQRVAIARAMVRNAPILVLDEPTTGLDADSARKVIEPLKRLMAGRTTIIVSHDLFAVREADRVIVIDDGEVAEAGTHEELLPNEGVYAGLYRKGSPEPLSESVGLRERSA